MLVAAVKDDVKAMGAEFFNKAIADTVASASDQGPRFCTVLVPGDGRGADKEVDELRELVDDV